MSYIVDPLSSPEVFYYMYETSYVLDDNIDFTELDSILNEVANSLDKSPTHVGAAREFKLELETYDEEYKSAEVIVSFVVRLWEDDDNEIELINKTIMEELESVGLQTENVQFLGMGRRGRYS
ncbi:MAG: hypothetical protein ACW981_12990 [Candidatus Hodarchaeales archaeon]|jgi:hypothetical protein